MGERRINKSRKSNPIIFTISKIRFLVSCVKRQQKKKRFECRVHCVWSTIRLTLRMADGRAYVEFNTLSCGGKGAKCLRWSRRFGIRFKPIGLTLTYRLSMKMANSGDDGTQDETNGLST